MKSRITVQRLEAFSAPYSCGTEFESWPGDQLSWYLRGFTAPI